jgi:DNA polymerase
LEDLWRTYYASIFNPARAKPRAMRKEMPARYWPAMPETDLIPQLLRSANSRVETMTAAARDNSLSRTAADFIPKTYTLPQLKEAARSCQGCDLHCRATQTVFGEGPATAEMVLVGEQPGDHEDLAGRPFVGPAGQLLDQILRQVGIDRSHLYLANVVKHFKWEPHGKRRIHQTPNSRDIAACLPWLHAELSVIKPQILVCLGATAARALIGRDFSITRHRGEILKTVWCETTLATYHPSALLRIPDPVAREEARHLFTADLTLAATRLSQKNRASAT